MMKSSRIVVGICGGIAAYKTATLVSRLIQRGHVVLVVMTHGATKFVGPATFQALCNSAPVIDPYDPRFPLGPHIELSKETDLLLIAPATARILASCSLGLADDLLSTLYLQCRCPVLMAPAMSDAMWDKKAVQRNIKQLISDGVHTIGPEEGWLSCREKGFGRMSEPEAILDAALKLL